MSFLRMIVLKINGTNTIRLSVPLAGLMLREADSKTIKSLLFPHYTTGVGKSATTKAMKKAAIIRAFMERTNLFLY